jgi:MFS family permease
MGGGISRLSEKQKVAMAIFVSALGYFVDVYDIALFSIVRVASLKDLGLVGDQLLQTGAYLINAQMIGMLIGGLFWGVLGDKVGRIQVLFGSILLYSVANIANAFVVSVDQYAVCRFFAGIGITLVSELLSKELRGFGTTIVATVGVLGAVVAALVGDLFHWQTAYIIGGTMGLVLLLMRVSVADSGLFQTVKSKREIKRGDLRLFLTSGSRMGRYLCCIVTGIPGWYASGIIITFSPELGSALGIVGGVKASTATLCYATAMACGDLCSGLLSHYFKSRKKVIVSFLITGFATAFAILNIEHSSALFFYSLCIPLGFCMGYWAVYITSAAEQFGTNIRATVTTSIPNFVRGSVVLLTVFLTSLKGAGFGIVASAQLIGVLVAAAAFCSLYFFRETYGVDLDFVESDDGIEVIE